MDGLRRAFLAVLAGLLAAGCTSHGGRPGRLLGGARPAPAVAVLRDLDDPLVTRVRVTTAAALGRPFAECVRSASASFSRGTAVVEQTAALGKSITFPDDTGQWVYGCFETGGPHERSGAWCGLAVGRRFSGKLSDPRLDVLCRTEQGVPVASAWVEPVAGARWVTLDQGGFTELYATAARLPIRVFTTRDVHLDGARAVFELAEYDAAGRLLVRTRLEARVAG